MRQTGEIEKMLLTPGLASVLSIPVSVTGRFPPIRGLSRPQGCGLALKNGLTHAALRQRFTRQQEMLCFCCCPCWSVWRGEEVQKVL